MDHGEMVALIRAGVAQSGGSWADLGAGTGNFTWALAELLGPAATVYAIDRDARAVATLQKRTPLANSATIIPWQADLTQRLNLPILDGVLVANALHFVRNQPAVFKLLLNQIRPNGCMLLVEYEQALPIPWVPFPLPYQRFAALAHDAGFQPIERVGQRISPSSGQVLYAAQAYRPQE